MHIALVFKIFLNFSCCTIVTQERPLSMNYIGTATGGLSTDIDAEPSDGVMEKLLDVRKQCHDRAHSNIQNAQQRQKEYYDAKHDSNHVRN